MCFEDVLRTIKTSNNDNAFSKKINDQSAIIKELTDKYSKFNIDDIIETRIKQAINIINKDNKKVLDDISNSFTEVKTYTIALKNCFDASQEEVSKLSMKLNQVTADNTRQKELWQELTDKEDMYKIEIINIIQAFQQEYRNYQRCSNNIIRKCHICQRTTQLANTCPKRGKISKIDIETEPDVEKDNNIEENSDDKSPIFSEYSKDIENINATCDIMESYSHLQQLSNGQLDLSKIQDAKLMKIKPNRRKGYTA
ncbi:hypothetical protein O181_083893, partial [Austropuccinia psidii MF-1]|nr:hypothetical protein [Austropuccinia psidii MF-1]